VPVARVAISSNSTCEEGLSAKFRTTPAPARRLRASSSASQPPAIVPISVRHAGNKSPLRPINTYCYPVRGFFGYRSNKANLESSSGRSLNPTPQNRIPNQLQGFEPPRCWNRGAVPCRRDLRLASVKLICITSQYVQNDALHCIAKFPLPGDHS
jgi:hypothetical protein